MKSTDRKGFTLIEMALVLVIIGLVMGTIAPLIKALSQSSRAHGEKKAVERAVDEVKGYLMLNRVLPTDFTSQISQHSNTQGGELFYLPSYELKGKDICQFKTTYLKVESYTDIDHPTEPGQTNRNYAFVIASPGPNRNLQLKTSPTTVKTYGPDFKVDDYTADGRIVTYYDDIVAGVNLAELSQVNCTLTLLNNQGIPITINGVEVPYNQTYSIQRYSSASIVESGTTSPQIYTYAQLLQADTSKNNALQYTSSKVQNK